MSSRLSPLSPLSSLSPIIALLAGVALLLAVDQRWRASVAGQGSTYSAGNVLTQGSALPGTCTVGALFSLTATPFGLFQCNAANIWSAVGSVGGSDWDVYINKSITQTITSNTTLVNDTELFFPVLTAQIWHIELLPAYDGDAFATDMKLQTTFPVARGISGALYVSSADVITESNVYVAGATTITQLSMATRSSIDNPITARLVLDLWISADGTFQVQHANLVSGVTRMLSGSILRAKKLR